MSNLNFLHSGGNKVTLSAPDSNPSSDVTLKLPQADGSNGQFLKTNGSGALSFATPTDTQGLAMADQWRLTTSTGNVPANSDTYITDNWSRVNSNGFGQLGTGMTQSTGIFTFPSTGIYLVHWHIETYASSNAMSRGMNRIYTTTNNSSYGFAANSNISLYTSGAYGSSDTFFQFDVTNTSTHKVRFLVYYQASGVQILGDSGANKTSATFLRLGDT